ncbi:MAG TPA: sigma-54-dependent Fis family transcriptional regulator [Ignavibacteria bacterium]|nr:sigma-54-dependent Fis family transcriptional regulator [Ignavibacteria bacterium]
MAKILIIDDDQSIRDTLTNYLKKKNFEIFSAKDGIEGFDKIKKHRPDLVISDIRMPGINGLELLKMIREFDNRINVIIMTAFDDMQSTIKAMQEGAYDFIEKPLELERLKTSIKRVLENKLLSDQLASFTSEYSDGYDVKNTLIGRTKEIKDVYKKIGQVSSSDVTVLIQGESGTGKELVAKAIHYSGATKNKPFIAVNCTALSETLLESELFGHVKGAFTGSIRNKKGKFELAGEGTIFLDEVSEISPNIQVKLLRVLQEREFERVGGETLINMKARVIAATNRDILQLVKDGKFREDLFYRLNVVSIVLPTLRKRVDDIPLLVKYFLTQINMKLHKNVNKVPENVMEMLKNYHWVGNVRELENTLMQAVVLSTGDVLEKENILLSKHDDKTTSETDLANLSLAEIEKIHIQRVLEANNWDKQKSSGILRISLPTLYSKIASYEIKPLN